MRNGPDFGGSGPNSTSAKLTPYPPGLMEQRFRSYGDLVTVVWGHVVNASDTTHKLAALVGSGIAERTWRDVGGQDFLPSQDFPTSCAAQQRRVYSEWGLSAARARARTTLATLALLAGGDDGGVRRSVQAVTLQRRQREIALAYTLAEAPPPLYSSPFSVLGDRDD